MSEDATPEAEATVPDETVAHVRAADRFRTVPLQWPVTYQGREIREVTIRRLSSKEVGEYIEQIKATGQRQKFPMTDVPDQVLDQLDDDDMDAVDEAILDFLPRRLRRLLDDTTPQPGAGTPSSSQAT